MKEHLNGHPPRYWHLKADETIIDVQNRVNYLEHNMGSGATTGGLTERSGSSGCGRTTSSISWMLSARA